MADVTKSVFSTLEVIVEGCELYAAPPSLLNIAAFFVAVRVVPSEQCELRKSSSVSRKKRGVPCYMWKHTIASMIAPFDNMIKLRTRRKLHHSTIFFS
jgi:hypothetical protein